MKIENLKNYVFIDGQNLNMSVKEEGWKMNWKNLFKYLTEKYKAKKIYYFIGYLPGNEKLYSFLSDIGYTLIFKKIFIANEKIKGNVDGELILKAATTTDQYDKAIIVSNDGDFVCLVDYLEEMEKFLCILTPNIKKCSILLKQSAKEKIRCLANARYKLEYKPRKQKSTA
jgi:uncharacterized LabA/DUF88 family protein